MKVWAFALVTLLWFWYLYYAFPGNNSFKVPLNFIKNENTLEASGAITIPPYRNYNVDVMFNSPMSSYNHECGIVVVEVGIYSGATLIDKGIATFLASYQHYIYELAHHLVTVVPHVLGFYSNNEILKKTVMSEIHPLTPQEIIVKATMHQDESSKFRYYDAYVVFEQIPQTWTQIFLYFALLLGFCMIGVTLLVNNAYKTRSLFLNK